MNELFEQLIQTYPSDLIISSEAGEWSINQDEPYAVPVPELFKSEELESADFPDNLIVFYHEGTINDLDEMSTLIIVNEVNVITKNSQNRIEAYPLEGIPDGAVDKKIIVDSVNSVKKASKFIPPIAVAFVLIGTMFYFAVFRLAYLLVVALILLAFGYLRGVKSTFRTYYKLSLHTLTLPLTMELLFIVLKPEAAYANWFFGLNLIFGIVVINHLHNVGAFKKKK